MDVRPVNLTEALASFDDVYSPRIAHTKGEHAWHVSAEPQISPDQQW